MTAPAADSTYGAITLFVTDIGESRDFYVRAFGVEPFFEEGDSAVFRLGGTIVNLLAEQAVPELISPGSMAPASAGARAVYTLEVPDVDVVVAHLAAAGIGLLNGPIDRWWGPRTASIMDPSGHIWEFATSAS